MDDKEQISDEEFIAKYVLAEQSCRFLIAFSERVIRLNTSAQLTSNPLIHKFQIIPSRCIAIASYMFSFRHETGMESLNSSYYNDRKNNDLTLAAFSLVLPIDM